MNIAELGTKVTSDTRDFEKGMQKVDKELDNKKKKLNKTTRNQKKYNKATGQASAVLFSFSQGAQDAAFSITGAANNIDPMISQFSRLKKTTGSTKGALKALGGAMMGPAGIATLAVAAGTLIIQKWDSIKGLFGDLQKSVSDLREEYKELKEDVVKFDEDAIFGKGIEIDNLFDAKQFRKALLREQQSIKTALGKNIGEGLSTGAYGELERLQQRQQSLLTQGRFEEAEAVQKNIDAQKRYIEGKKEELVVTETHLEQTDKLIRKYERISQGRSVAQRAAERAGITQQEITRSAEKEAEAQRSVLDILRKQATERANTTVNTTDPLFNQRMGSAMAGSNAMPDSIRAVKQQLENLNMNELISDQSRSEKKMQILVRLVNKLNSQGMALTQDAFNNLVDMLGLSADEAAQLRKEMKGAAQESKELSKGAQLALQSIDRIGGSIGSSIGTALFGNQQNTNQLQLQRLRLQQQKSLLKKNLKEREISYREYTLRVQRLSNQMSSVQKKLAIQTSNTFKRVFHSLKDTVGNIVQEIISDITKAIAKAAALKALMMIPGVGQGLGLVGSGGQALGFGSLVGKFLPFAEGGIVTGPTLGLIGEGGEDEAVFPLSKLDRFLSSRAGGRGRIEAKTEVSMDRLVLAIREHEAFAA